MEVELQKLGHPSLSWVMPLPQSSRLRLFDITPSFWALTWGHNHYPAWLKAVHILQIQIFLTEITEKNN